MNRSVTLNGPVRNSSTAEEMPERQFSAKRKSESCAVGDATGRWIGARRMQFQRQTCSKHPGLGAVPPGPAPSLPPNTRRRAFRKPPLPVLPIQSMGTLFLPTNPRGPHSSAPSRSAPCGKLRLHTDAFILLDAARFRIGKKSSKKFRISPHPEKNRRPLHFFSRFTP